MSADNNSIQCLSHLAWEPTLFQRPQQLMQRFAARGYRVSYVGCVGVRRKRDLPESGTNVNLKWTHSGYAPGVSKLAAMRQRLASLEVRKLSPGPLPIVWLYHPSLYPLIEKLPRKLLVYDVMDRFDSFDKNGEAAAADEKVLLERADVIFTGGSSLQTAVEQKLSGISRRGAGPVCFPSGIDYEHFATAAAQGQLPPDLDKLPRPVFGYFGAIDERIDYELLSKLAATGGSVALIGPQIGEPAQNLHPNIHMLGPQAYKDLPSYLRGFDVCLLPFRQTALVAHISPTKTPEYLAGGKPVVSTMIPDVALMYGDIVNVAKSAEEFVAACVAAAAAPPDAQRHQDAARRGRSWEQIATEMDAILQQNPG